MACATQHLSFDEKQYLSENCTQADLAAGDTLYHEGTPTAHVAYLRTGLVKEVMTGVSGREQIFKLLGAKSYLGMTSLFGDRINHFSYIALRDINVCFINSSAFQNLINDNGKFAFELMVTLCKDNLKGSHKLINQSQKKIYGRVADAILYLSDYILKTDSFELPLSQAEIANLIGTTRESTNRALMKFISDGLISIDGNFLIIKDKRKLELVSNLG